MIFLRVAVAADAPTGRPFAVRVGAKGLATSARSAGGVREVGAAARFAADGRLTTRVAGNTLVGAPASGAPCAGTRGRVADTADTAAMVLPIDRDDDPSTRTSSCATLDLPAEGEVLWAGLYWSGFGRGVVPSGDVRVRPPGARSYTTLHATEVARHVLPEGAGYQAFADVTSLVRTAGSGRWWVADAVARRGSLGHAGWSLVTVVTDPRQPYGRTVVLDTAAVVGKDKALSIPLDGLAPVAAPARIDLILWNGEGGRDGYAVVRDRSLPGEPGRLPGKEHGRVTGRTPGAVDTLHALLGRRPVLHLTTKREGLHFGVAVVTTYSWS